MFLNACHELGNFGVQSVYREVIGMSNEEFQGAGFGSSDLKHEILPRTWRLSENICLSGRKTNKNKRMLFRKLLNICKG